MLYGSFESEGDVYSSVQGASLLSPVSSSSKGLSSDAMYGF